MASWAIKPDFSRPSVIHVNSTAAGGGVAEIISALVPAQNESGMNAGWMVIDGDADFFELTGEFYNLLYNRDLHQIPIATKRIDHYFHNVAKEVVPLLEMTGDGHVVVLHDTQPLGMAVQLQTAGFTVVWHCHVGTMDKNPIGPAAIWKIFAEQIAALSAVVTTASNYAPPSFDEGKLFVVAPAIDPNAPKNRTLERAEIARYLGNCGLTAGSTPTGIAQVTQLESLPDVGPLVVQISRWDPVKDMLGVLKCVSRFPSTSHLVLAGPDPSTIADDSSGRAVFAEAISILEQLPLDQRRRVHLVRTAARSGPDESAFLINALQRSATVVLQKSIDEGFGLTVTEAMLKGCAVVAGRVGGIPDQIDDGVTGLLVDPRDLDAVGAAVTRLIRDSELRTEMGRRASESARHRYTIPRLVADYQDVVTAVKVRV